MNRYAGGMMHCAVRAMRTYSRTGRIMADLKEKKGIIFDLDGTLWDACAVMSKAWNDYMRENEPELVAQGIASTEEIMRKSCGKTMLQLADILLGRLDPEQRYAISDACWDYVVGYIGRHGGQPFPGMKDSLRELKKTYQLFIVSNGQAGYIQDFMRLTGTEDLFTDTEDFGTTKLSKGQNIRLVIERNALDSAVYVGDTRMDLEAAQEAGIPFVHAAYGFGEVPEAENSISGLDQLKAVADGLL